MNDTIVLGLVIVILLLVLYKSTSGFTPSPGFIVNDQYSDIIKNMAMQNQSAQTIIQELKSRGLSDKQAFDRLAMDPHFGMKSA